jgi:hypothetical protein
MSTKNKIALSFPVSDKPARYFSVQLKQDIYNERGVYVQPSKMFVVADIEGNFYNFCTLLIKGGVMNNALKWTFGDGHLVVLGDCFDRGEQVIECLWLIYSLEEKAKKNGGYVHFILGNHEIMNLNGDWRYVHPKYAASSKVPYTALYYGNNELWRWLCTKNIIEKLGNVLFVHAGIANELLQLNLSVAELNNIARPYYTRANESVSDPAVHAIFNPDFSPFWYRGYYLQNATEELIDATLKHFEVESIVTGHTIVEKISTFFNGKVINADTDHASGNSEALFIKNDKFYRIDKEGNRERLK